MRISWFGWLVWLARRRWLACCLVALLALAGRLALLPWRPVPQPGIHDEFSYLLAADTFASGRLTNPPHPFWIHFESFHILQQPTYASKYPPLQGLVLAAGQRLGDPWLGVLLSTSAMCGLLCWMLQGWLPPFAALLGALLAVLRVGISGYWIDSYWGGAVAAAGGALVLGALPRLQRRATWGCGFAFAAGAAILINSRPYEGALVCGATGAVLLWTWLRRTDQRWQNLGRFAMASAIVLLPVFGWMAYYNWRVTGSALRLPYQLHEAQYSVASAFLWQAPRPAPVYHHAIMARLWSDWDLDVFNTSRTHVFEVFLIKLYILYGFFLNDWVLLIPLLAWPYLRFNRRARMAFLLFGIFLLGLVPEKTVLPHYAAPATGLIYLLIVYGWRYWWFWRPNCKPRGALIAQYAMLICVAHAVHDLATASPSSWARFAAQRTAIADRLHHLGGKHLVLVRYTPAHSIHEEWAYNRADIDASEIVWAREMDRDHDRPLVDYYRGRRIWLLEPDAQPPRLTPYDGSLSAAVSSER